MNPTTSSSPETPEKRNLIKLWNLFKQCCGMNETVPDLEKDIASDAVQVDLAEIDRDLEKDVASDADQVDLAEIDRDLEKDVASDADQVDLAEIDRDLEKELAALIESTDLSQEAINTVVDKEGKTILFDIIRYGYALIDKQIHFNFIRKLIENRADLTIENSKYGTIFHMAAFAGQPEDLKLLFEIGDSRQVQAVLNQPFKNTTPLQMAITKFLKTKIDVHFEMIKLFVEAKADLRVKDSKGNMPLQIAILCKEPKMISLFIKADPELFNYPGILVLAKRKQMSGILSAAYQTALSTSDEKTTAATAKPADISKPVSSSATPPANAPTATSDEKTETKTQTLSKLPRGIYDVFYDLQTAAPIHDKAKCDTYVQTLLKFGTKFTLKNPVKTSRAIILLCLMNHPERIKSLLEKQILFACLFFAAIIQELNNELIELEEHRQELERSSQDSHQEKWQLEEIRYCLIKATIFHNAFLEKSKNKTGDLPLPPLTSPNEKLEAAKAYFLVGKIDLGLMHFLNINPLPPEIRDLLITYSIHKPVSDALLNLPCFDTKTIAPLIFDILISCKQNNLTTAENIGRGMVAHDIYEAICHFFSGREKYLTYCKSKKKKSLNDYFSNCCLLVGEASYLITDACHEETFSLFDCIREFSRYGSSWLDLQKVVHVWHPDFLLPEQGISYVLLCAFLTRNHKEPDKANHSIELTSKYLKEPIKKQFPPKTIVDGAIEQLQTLSSKFIQNYLDNPVGDTGFTVGILLIQQDQFPFLKKFIEMAYERGIDIAHSLHALLPTAKNKSQTFVDLLKTNIPLGYQPTPKPVKAAAVEITPTSTPSHTENKEDTVSPTSSSATQTSSSDDSLLSDRPVIADMNSSESKPMPKVGKPKLSEVISGIKNGDIALVKQWLNSGGNINAKDLENDDPECGGNALLTYAAKYGKVDIINFLLENEAKLNILNYVDCLPLMVALMNGHLESAKALIAPLKQLPLATRKQILNQSASFNYTALHMAVAGNHLEIVRLLIAEDANVNKQSDNGSPLEIALKLGHTDIVRCLVAAGAIVNDEIKALAKENGIQNALEKNDNSHPAPLPEANSAPTKPKKKKKKGKKKDKPTSATESKDNQHDQRSDARFDINKKLHSVIKDIEASDFSRWLDSGISVDDVDDKGLTLLHYAIVLNRSDLAAILVSRNADVTRVDHKNQTPLMIATIKKNKELVETLLSTQAGKSIVNNTKGSEYAALHLAVSENDFESVKLLVAAKADVNQECQHGRPLEIAFAQGRDTNIIQCLMHHGAIADGAKMQQAAQRKSPSNSDGNGSSADTSEMKITPRLNR